MNCIRKLAAAGLVGAICAYSADEQNPKKELPTITATIPFVLIAGVTNTFKVRGHNLTNATALRFIAHENLTARITGRGPTPAPDKSKKASETQLEVELVAPTDLPTVDLSFVITTLDGETGTNRLRVLSRDLVFDEQETNGGFRTANPVAVPQAIRGKIEVAADVDVFRIQAKAGDQLRIEALSSSYGSPLDPVITIHEARGHTLLTRDDSAGTTEPSFDFSAPTDGVYLLSIIDAHDRGGDNYTYLLILQRE